MGCPGSTLGKGIPFLDCLLLFSKLGCPGSTLGRGILFLDCLLLFSKLGCPGNMPGRGIPFLGCLLLFSGLICPGSAHGDGIHFPGCINARGGGRGTPIRVVVSYPTVGMLISEASNFTCQQPIFFSFLPSFLLSLLHYQMSNS
jgi:hypothetical protein